MNRKGQLLQQSQTLLRLNGNESSIQNASTPVNVTVPVKNYSTENNNANVNATVRRALEADNAASSNDIIQSSSSQTTITPRRSLRRTAKQTTQKIQRTRIANNKYCNYRRASIPILVVG